MSEPDYRWNAREYERCSSAQWTWARELMAKLAVRGDERIVNIGCGDGKITAALAARVPGGAVVGVDSSEDMIRLARERFPADRYPNLSFCHEDMRALDFAAAFDIAFSNAALHWVLDHQAVLAGVRRGLKPSGWLLFQTAARGNAAEVWRIVQALIARPRWAPYFTGFSFPYGLYGVEEYRGWLARAGLVARRVERVPKVMTQAGREGLAGWIRTTWLPYTQRIPGALRERFIAAIVDEYLRAYPPDDEGLVHVSMARLEIEASRAH